MILHTVNQSPTRDSSFSDCLRWCNAGDSVLLLEDGVYAAMAQSPVTGLIDDNTKIPFYALAADIQARGLQAVHPRVQLISDSEFVTLCVQHHSVQSWYA